MTTPVLVVFTRKPFEEIQANGGTGNWKIDPPRVIRTPYVVCTSNSHDRHGAAFVIGKPGEPRLVRRDELGRPRYFIPFTDFAQIDRPNVWDGQRNPVKYTTLEALGIDPAELDFQPMPQRTEAERQADLSPSEAKAAVARHY